MEAAYSSPYKQRPSVRSFSNQTAAVSKNINAHWKLINQFKMHSLAVYEPPLVINNTLNGQILSSRARIKAALGQLLSPFGQVVLKNLKGLLRKNSYSLHTLFSAVLCNSFWMQIFLGILLHSAFYR